uniref:7TM_GPCR_Srx domain-containing protein n=2 Tax=Caenorhabditis japonica TaxID=281687 RepID=A0A8R1HN65_CAEJA
MPTVGEVDQGDLFIPESQLMSLVFHIVAVLAMFLISLSGLFVNLFLFNKFAKKPGKASGFHKLCLAKTIPNSIVCTAFFVWGVPLALFQPDYENVPRWLNVFIGQLAGFGAYVTGPLLQCCMSCNRFAVLYFSTRLLKVTQYPITGMAIIGVFLVAVIYTSLGFRPGNCGFVFYPSTFTWDREDSTCAAGMSTLIFYTVVGVATSTNILNMMTAAKLSVDKSVIQDCLHVIDLINSIFVFKLYDALWFQFIFLSISFLMIHALDGFVMFFFHPEVHPSFLQSKASKGTLVTIVPQSFLVDRKFTVPSF